MTLPLEHLAEYDSAAQWCAQRGLKGAIGDPLPTKMATDGALKYIQADPEAFQERVRECAYELSSTREKIRKLAMNNRNCKLAMGDKTEIELLTHLRAIVANRYQEKFGQPLTWQRGWAWEALSFIDNELNKPKKPI